MDRARASSLFVFLASAAAAIALIIVGWQLAFAVGIFCWFSAFRLLYSTNPDRVWSNVDRTK